MYVQRFAVEAFISAFWGADEAEALVAPTDPASRVSVAEVDQQVGVYLRDIMNDLLDRHGNLGHVHAILSDMARGHIGGHVHGFAVKAFVSAFLGVDEAEALFAPTDPASCVSVAIIMDARGHKIGRASIIIV